MNNWNGTGYLTRDPELTITDGGTIICQMRIATRRPRKNGEDQGADFFKIKAFGGQATTCHQYLTKGRLIAVTGAIRHFEWADKKTGDRREGYEIEANRIEFLDRTSAADTDTDAEVALAA